LFWLSGKPKVKCFKPALLSIHGTLGLINMDRFYIKVLVILAFLMSCGRTDYLKEDKWIEYQLVRPDITVSLPQSFRFLTEYPESSKVYFDTTTIFLWPDEPHIAVGIHSQFDNFEKWYKNEKATVKKQKRKIYRQTKTLGQYEFDLISYSKFDKKDTSTYIGYAFVTIDGILFDIHNQLESDESFLKFLNSLKKN